MAEITSKIAEILAQKFEAEEAFKDFFLVEIKLHPQNLLEIFLDSDSTLNIDQCAKINRFLQAILDENGWLGEQYVLEVSSPGISAGLKLPRQYRKNIGRDLKVEVLAEEAKTTYKGKLSRVEENGIVLSRQERVLVEEGKKKKHNIEVEQFIPFEQIQKAVVQVVFR